MDNVAQVLAPAVQAVGLVLEDVTVSPAGKRRVVRVTVDIPQDQVGALPLDDIADVSRSIAAVLDETDVLGGSPYVLEVSSPGVDRPLTEPRHWRRARTRLVSVPVEGVELSGRVVSVGDDAVTLDVGGQERRIAWADLGTGRMQVEFTHQDSHEQDSHETEQLDEEA